MPLSVKWYLLINRHHKTTRYLHIYRTQRAINIKDRFDTQGSRLRRNRPLNVDQVELSELTLIACTLGSLLLHDLPAMPNRFGPCAAYQIQAIVQYNLFDAVRRSHFQPSKRLRTTRHRATQFVGRGSTIGVLKDWIYVLTVPAIDKCSLGGTYLHLGFAFRSYYINLRLLDPFWPQPTL